jgi:hypothetical protein
VLSSAGIDASVADEDEDDGAGADRSEDIEVSNVGDVNTELLTFEPVRATDVEDVLVIEGSPADIEE